MKIVDIVVGSIFLLFSVSSYFELSKGDESVRNKNGTKTWNQSLAVKIFSIYLPLLFGGYLMIGGFMGVPAIKIFLKETILSLETSLNNILN